PGGGSFLTSGLTDAPDCLALPIGWRLSSRPVELQPVRPMAAARSTPARSLAPPDRVFAGAGPECANSRASENKFVDGAKTVWRLGMDLPLAIRYFKSRVYANRTSARIPIEAWPERNFHLV